MDLLRRAVTIATFSTLCVLGAAPRGAVQAGTITTLHTFGTWHDSATTGLVYGPGGALYGATISEIYQLSQDAAGRWHYQTIYGGGATSIAGSPSALYAALSSEDVTPSTAFELLPPAKGSAVWKTVLLHNFNGGKNGSGPSGITLASDGSLYGTTEFGGGFGSSVCWTDPPECGTIYKLAEVNGRWGERLVYAFRGGVDGSYPMAAPSIDAAGDVFVTASEGDLETAADVGCGRLIELRAPLLTMEDYDLCDYLGPRFSYSPESVVYPVPSANAPAST